MYSRCVKIGLLLSTESLRAAISGDHFIFMYKVVIRISKRSMIHFPEFSRIERIKLKINFLVPKSYDSCVVALYKTK